MNGCGHEDCQRQTAYPTLCLHAYGVPVTMGQVALAEAVAHRHRWVFDAAEPGGMVTYHCDAHDPPEVRRVHVAATADLT